MKIAGHVTIYKLEHYSISITKLLAGFNLLPNFDI
jgi:hypothetical protein